MKAKLPQAWGVYGNYMRTIHFALVSMTAASLAAISCVRAEDPLPPTVPGSSFAPPSSPSTPTTPAAKNPSQQSPSAAPGGNGAQAGNRLEKLKEELGLTPEQMKQIRPILKKEYEEAKPVRENTSLPPEQKRTKLRAIFMAAFRQMKPILTPAQLAKLKELHKEHAKNAATT